jgi:hypothetical protein
MSLARQSVVVISDWPTGTDEEIPLLQSHCRLELPSESALVAVTELSPSGS